MEFVNGKDDIPYMKWKITHIPNHQPVYIYIYDVSQILRIWMSDIASDYAPTLRHLFGACRICFWV